MLDSDHVLLLQGSAVLFPAPMSDSSQLSVNPAPGDLVLLAFKP